MTSTGRYFIAYYFIPSHKRYFFYLILGWTKTELLLQQLFELNDTEEDSDTS